MSGGAVFGLAVLALLLVVNVRASRRVLASDEDGFRRKMFVAGVWIIPFFGALALKDVGRAAPSEERSEAPGAGEPAPAQVQLADGRAFAVHAHIALVQGVPHVAWEAAHAFLGEAPAAADVSAIRRAWLLHLRDALGEGYRLHTSEHAVCVSSLDDVTARALLAYVANTRKRILRTLKDVAHFNPGEQSTVVVLDDDDTYYHYLSSCHGEGGEFGFSSGVFIPAGCPHFVVKRSELHAIEAAIAHELTHSALAHLDLPLWVDEGLAVNTERALAGATPTQHTAQQLHGKHVAFWDTGRIQEFWSGHSFRRTDDGQMLSYELARILVQEMSRDWASFASFARSAQREDAGDAAARVLLGVDLGASVCALFDKAPSARWSPDPNAWWAREAPVPVPRGTMSR